MRLRPLLIKVGDNYGLCNRLFPFAHLISCAEEYGFEIRNAAFFEFMESFEGTADQLLPQYPQRTNLFGNAGRRFSRFAYPLLRRLWRKLRLENAIVLGDHDVCDLSSPEMLQTLGSQRATQLFGLYFHNPRTFDKHAELVRAYFRPVAAIREIVSTVLLPARMNADLVVGVHVRHGDYLTFCDGIMYYTTAEYGDLMRQVLELFPGQRVSFLVCSNGDATASDFHGLRVTMGPGHAVADLYAMAACDYLIGPPSTFSEWASFYGNVPRYVHRAKDYERNDQTWPGVRLQDFVVHAEGFARCSPDHPVSLV